MAEDAAIKELLAKQQALVDKAMKLNEMSDGEAITREAKKLEEEGKKLQAAADGVAKKKQGDVDALAAKYGVEGPSEPKMIKVQLTDEQRQRVLDDTGVRIEVVELEEGTDVAGERWMPGEHPSVVEKAARKKAEQRKAQQAGKEQAREDVNKALEELEKGPADLQRLLAEKKKDPDFVANRLASED